MFSDSLIRWWANWLTKYAAWVLLVIAAITVVAASQLIHWQDFSLKLRVDPSINRLLGDDDPQRQFYERYRNMFGNDDVVLVAVGNVDVRDISTLNRLDQMTGKLEAIPGVYQLASLSNISVARSEGEDLILDQLPNLGSREAVSAALKNNALYSRVLYSDDYSVAATLISLRDVGDREFLKRGLADQMQGIAEQAFSGTDAVVWVSGTPVIKAATAAAVMKQFRGSLPVVLGLVALFLLLAFRSPRGVIMPMLAIGIALTWTLGLLAALDIPLNLITSLVPTLIIILGLAYSMHMMTAYFRPLREDSEGEGADVQLRMRVTLQRTAMAMLLAGLTTSAGFLALYVSDLAAIREFALISTLGILLTVILVLSFIPAALRFLPSPRLRLLPGNALFIRFANRLAGFVLKYRPIIIKAGIGFVLLCLLASTRIHTGTHYVEGFKPDAPVRLAFENINQQLAGANSLAIVIDGYVDDTFVDPVMLGAIEELQTWLNEQPEIGKTVSLVDVVKLVNRDLSGSMEYFRLPEKQAAIKQLLVFGAGSQVDALVDKRFATTQIRVQTPLADSREVSQLAAKIEKQLQTLPARLDAQLTGNALLATSTVNALAGSQLSSIALALFAVFLVLAAMFSSWKFGFLALLPNLLPVGAFFGILGAFDIGLNPTTSLIACIVLGIAVDDTIHFLARFNQDARALASERDAVASALRHIIRPVSFTSLALVLGFLYLTTSELQNQVRFGALAALTIGVAWVVDVIFTPALGSTMRFVTLWDSLRLDMGSEPEKTIPLLNGLSARQAKVFALLTHFDSLDEGDRLITQGEEARDMFVVVDGILSVSVDDENGKREIASSLRGTVLGEVGSFGQLRSANVDAITASRVLRFNDDDLEGLRRAQPKIAATIYRNLNRIQAERLASATRQLNA